jgi:sugar phosphate isomerase/epimerase
MLHSGLCSVTFRKLPVEEIIRLARQARLEGIEWGGDVHVPHGQADLARRVRELTATAGLAIPSYGSYYTVAHSEAAGPAFAAVLDSAEALGAKTIRVWAGQRPSKDLDPAYRRSVEDDSRRIADLAAQRGITVSYEFHGGTLTDTTASGVALMQTVGPAGLKIYWQPPLKLTRAERLAGLSAVRPWLTHLHVYHHVELAEPVQVELAQGESAWLEYLRLAAGAPGDRYALLEFVPDGSPESLLRDAGTLNAWIKRINEE